MFNFTKFTPLYFLISLSVIMPGLISLALYGLKPAIDFTGGSLLEVKIFSDQVLTDSDISNALDSQIEISTIQSLGDNSFILRASQLSNQENQTLLNTLSSLGKTEEIRFETVGPTLGKELLEKTYVAITLASLAILGYVAWQFKEIKYGICAVIAMLHDTIIVVGTFSLLGHFYNVEVDTLFVTAVLTILSFSVHDTIVVYDRIRESEKLHRNATFSQIVNKSIAETLSRSINNSMTIIFMLSALYLLGGVTIRWFVFALLIGTVTGTYSSTFTAAPLLVTWEKVFSKKK